MSKNIIFLSIKDIFKKLLVLKEMNDEHYRNSPVFLDNILNYFRFLFFLVLIYICDKMSLYPSLEDMQVDHMMQVS